MSDLSDLYQEVILDHNKRPRNFRRPEGADHEAKGYNPLCGDQITLFLRMRGDVIDDIGFEGSGCAVSKASASMMTDALKGKTLAHAEALFESFRALVTGGEGSSSSGTADRPPGDRSPRSADRSSATADRSSAAEDRSSALADPSSGTGEVPVSARAGRIPLGKLSVFAGVSEFPMRVKCATLAWHTMRAALDGKKEAVSTE